MPFGALVGVLAEFGTCLLDDHIEGTVCIIGTSLKYQMHHCADAQTINPKPKSNGDYSLVPSRMLALS